MRLFGLFEFRSILLSYARSIFVPGIFFLLASTPSFATTLKELLQSEDRPTMLQVAEALNWDFSKSWNNELDFSGLESGFIKRVKSHGPELIAQLELAFPGAKWLPLGRDAVITGDVLDAFYISQGQQTRVFRINASKGSFSSAVPLIGIFKDLELVDSNGTPKTNFVILDPTPYRADSSHISQSRRLISAVFNAIPKDRRSYLSQIGVIDLDGNHTQIRPHLEPSFLKNLHLDQNGPAQILSTTVNLHHSAEWHGSFGPFYTDHEGKVLTKPGSVSDLSVRKTILATMIEILRITGSDSFAKEVDYQYKQYGSSVKWGFSVDSLTSVFESIRRLSSDPEQLEKATAELKDLSEVRALEIQLLTSVLVKHGFSWKSLLNWNQSHSVTLGEILISASSETLDTLYEDFLGLEVQTKIALIDQWGSKLAGIIIQAMNLRQFGFKFEEREKENKIFRLVHLLDPSWFEKNLAAAKNAERMEYLIGLLDRPSSSQIQVLDRQAVHLGVYVEGRDTLKKLKAILSPDSFRGLASVYLERDLSVSELLDFDQAFFAGDQVRKRIVKTAFRKAFSSRSVLLLTQVLDYLQRIQGGSDLIEPLKFVNYAKEISLITKVFQFLRNGEEKESFLLILLNRISEDQAKISELLTTILPTFKSNGPVTAELSSFFNQRIEKDLPLNDQRQNYLVLKKMIGMSPSSFDLALSYAKTEFDWQEVFKAMPKFTSWGDEIFEKYLPAFLQYHSNHELMLKGFRALCSEGKKNSFLTALIKSYSTAEEILNGVPRGWERLWGHFAVEGPLDHFFSLNPSVSQVNLLSQLAGNYNERARQEILIRAFSLIKTREEFKALNRPARRIRERHYIEAEKKFKKAHPHPWNLFHSKRLSELFGLHSS